MSSNTPARRTAAFRDVLSAAAAGLLAAWLYRRALGFAFFNDDPTGHFAWMESRSWWSFFTSSADYGYYRPVVFTTLRAMERVFGGHSAPADHALLLLLHAANAALVWWLARALGRRRAYAWVAVLVFIAAPFSYEAVIYVASLTHPLLLFWLLLTLFLYEWGRRGGRPAAYWLAGLTMCLGLLTHENGLLIFPALLGLEWAGRRPADLRALLARPLPYFALPPALYAILWLSVPKNSEQTFALTHLGRNIVPFLQTLAFPLLPGLRLDAADIWALAVAAGAVLLLTAYLAYAAGAWRLWCFAVGWIILSALPSLLFLSPDYLYGSPRLHYLPSVGVGLLWGLPVLWLWHVAGQDGGERAALRRWAIWGVTAVYALAIAWPPQSFIRCQLDFYEQTSRIVRRMGETGAAAGEGRELIFVNLPFFFSSYPDHPNGCPNPYPWTPVGAVIVPPYAQARDFVRFNGGPARPTQAVTFDGYAPGWRAVGSPMTAGRLRDAAAMNAVMVFDLATGGFFDLSTAWRPGGATNETPLATFGEVLNLADVNLVESSEILTLEANWAVRGTPDFPVALFVHVYDEMGAVAAQHDVPPGGGFIPPALWQPGDAIRERITLNLAGLAPGDYTVKLGLYNPLDGTRLPAIAGDQRLPDDAYPIGTLSR